MATGNEIEAQDAQRFAVTAASCCRRHSRGSRLDRPAASGGRGGKAALPRNGSDHRGAAWLWPSQLQDQADKIARPPRPRLLSPLPQHRLGRPAGRGRGSRQRGSEWRTPAGRLSPSHKEEREIVGRLLRPRLRHRRSRSSTSTVRRRGAGRAGQK